MNAPGSALLVRAVRLAPEATVAEIGGELAIAGPSRHARVGASPAAWRMLSLLAGWAPLESACDVPGLDTEDPLAVLRACREAGALDEGLLRGGRIVAEMRMTPGSGLGPEVPPRADPPYRLADFASLGPAAGGWRLTSPCAPAEAVLHDPAALADLWQASDGWRPADPDSQALAGLLASGGLLTGAPPKASALSGSELRLHAASRPGSGVHAFAARDRIASLSPPALRDDAGSTPLPQPPASDAMGFRALLARRRSQRAVGGSVTRGEIGALLWLTARDHGPPQRDSVGFERLHRPYPGAGSAGEIDLYLATRDGLAHYDAANHALRPLGGAPDALLGEAGAAMGLRGEPAALVILVARFGRMSWKYGDASYALILKNAGVVLQTLHLGATALGLGSCILGAGNSREFARATGTDPLSDGPVGEIAVTGRLEAGDEGEEEQ